MKDTVYVVFNADGIRRTTKTWPNLYAGELAVRVLVTVPPEVFKQPIPTADLEVPAEAIVSEPFDAVVEVDGD